MDDKVLVVKDVLKKIKKNLECAICLDVLSDPYSSQCNHAFCRECISTVISSSKQPKCPLCKETISRRSIHENSRLAEIVKGVQKLEFAILADTGLTGTPPIRVPDCREASGTPGMIMHSLLHPTPTKPGPSLARRAQGEEVRESVDSAGETVSRSLQSCRRKRKGRLRNIRNVSSRGRTRKLATTNDAQVKPSPSNLASERPDASSEDNQCADKVSNLFPATSLLESGTKGIIVSESLPEALQNTSSNEDEDGTFVKPSIQHCLDNIHPLPPHSASSQVISQNSASSQLTSQHEPKSQPLHGHSIHASLLCDTSSHQDTPDSQPPSQYIHVGCLPSLRSPSFHSAHQDNPSDQSSHHYSHNGQPLSQHGPISQPSSPQGSSSWLSSPQGSSRQPSSPHNPSGPYSFQHGTNTQSSLHVPISQPLQLGLVGQPSLQHVSADCLLSQDTTSNHCLHHPNPNRQPSSPSPTNQYLFKSDCGSQPSSQSKHCRQPIQHISTHHSSSQPDRENRPSSQHISIGSLSSQQGPSSQHLSQHSPSCLPLSQHSPSCLPSSQHSPNCLPSSQQGPGCHPLPQHIPSGQLSSQHCPSCQVSSPNVFSRQCSSQCGCSSKPSLHCSPTVILPSQHTPGGQPSSQHTPGSQPSSQHTPGSQPSSQHTPGSQPSSQHIPSGQPSSQHTPGSQPSSQHIPGSQLSSHHTGSNELVSPHSPITQLLCVPQSLMESFTQETMDSALNSTPRGPPSSAQGVQLLVDCTTTANVQSGAATLSIGTQSDTQSTSVQSSSQTASLQLIPETLPESSPSVEIPSNSPVSVPCDSVISISCDLSMRTQDDSALSMHKSPMRTTQESVVQSLHHAVVQIPNRSDLQTPHRAVVESPHRAVVESPHCAVVESPHRAVAQTSHGLAVLTPHHAVTQIPPGSVVQPPHNSARAVRDVVEESPVIPLQHASLNRPMSLQDHPDDLAYGEGRVDSTPQILPPLTQAMDNFAPLLAGLSLAHSPQTWPKCAKCILPVTSTQPNPTREQKILVIQPCTEGPPVVPIHDDCSNTPKTPCSSVSASSLETSGGLGSPNELSVCTIATNESFNTQDIELLQSKLERKEKEVQELDAHLQTSTQHNTPTNQSCGSSLKTCNQNLDPKDSSKVQNSKLQYQEEIQKVCSQNCMNTAVLIGGEQDLMLRDNTEDCQSTVQSLELDESPLSLENTSLSKDNCIGLLEVIEDRNHHDLVHSDMTALNSPSVKHTLLGSLVNEMIEEEPKDCPLQAGLVVSIVEVCNGEVVETRGVVCSNAYNEESQDPCQPVECNTVPTSTVPPQLEPSCTVLSSVNSSHDVPLSVNCCDGGLLEEDMCIETEEFSPDCSVASTNPLVIPSTFKTPSLEDREWLATDLSTTSHPCCEDGHRTKCEPEVLAQNIAELMEVSVIHDSLPLPTQRGLHPCDSEPCEDSPSLLRRPSDVGCSKLTSAQGKHSGGSKVSMSGQARIFCNNTMTIESSPSVLGETQDLPVVTSVTKWGEKGGDHAAHEVGITCDAEDSNSPFPSVSMKCVPSPRNAAAVVRTSSSSDFHKAIGKSNQPRGGDSVRGSQSFSLNVNRQAPGKGQTALSFVNTEEKEKLAIDLPPGREGSSPNSCKNKSSSFGVVERPSLHQGNKSTEVMKIKSPSSCAQRVSNRSNRSYSGSKKRSASMGSNSPGKNKVSSPVTGWCSARKRSKNTMVSQPGSEDPPTTRRRVRRESVKKTTSQRKSLQEFWQPQADKMKRLDFISTDSLSNFTSEQARMPPKNLLGEKAAVETDSKITLLRKPLSYQQGPVVTTVKKSLTTVQPSPCCGVVPSGTKKFSLVSSALQKEQIKCLQDFATSHGIRLASVFNSCTTHVVTNTDENNRCVRTVKYLQGLAAGKWILSYSWIQESVKAGCVLQENGFEVTGDSLGSLTGVPKRARESKSLLNKGLFDNHVFSLHGDFLNIGKEQLVQILKLSGATICSSSVRSGAIVLCDPSYLNEEADLSHVTEHPALVSVDWVINSLSDYNLQPLEPYAI